MGIQLKSLASAIAVGFALLAFGPAASKANADHLGAPVVVQRGFAPVRHRAFVRPHRFARPYRAYRVVRVFAPFPFPHWVYRRVYYGPHASYAPYAGAYRPY